MSEITYQSKLDGFLLFIPLLFHTTLSSVSINELHHTIKEKTTLTIFLSSSVIMGAILAFSITISETLNHIFLAFIGGALLFIITREVIPKENKGDPLNFILGLSVYSLLIISTWLL